MRSQTRAVAGAVVMTAALLAACGDPSVQSGDASSLTEAGTTTSTLEVVDTTEPEATTTTTLETTTTESTTTTTTSTTVAPSTDPPLECINPSELVPMVSATSDGYDEVGNSEGLGSTDDREVALMTAGGAVATQAGSGDDASVEYRIGPQDSPITSGTIEHALLYDIVATEFGPAVLYGEIYQGDEEPLAYVQLLDIGTGTTTQITESQAVEYFVYRAAAADGIVVVSAVADLTEAISTWNIDGSGEIERFSPVLAENYGLPPFYGPAVPSPDGERLAWLEGPDVEAGSGDRQGDWQLVVADAETGEEELRLFLGESDEQFAWFDWDGRYAVLSRGKDDPVIGIDTDQPEYSPFDICDPSGDGLLNGVVTFVVS